MNRSVSLNGYNLRDKFDMIMTSKIISKAEIKKDSIDVPNADGDTDLSNALTGDVSYKNRNVTITLVKDIMSGELLAFQSEFDNLFHGQEVKVTFEETPNYYWIGRANVDHKPDKVIDTVTIVIDAYPYQLKKNKTFIKETIETSKTIVCPNIRKWVSPSFKASSDMTIQFGNNTYAIGAKAKILAGLVFKQGENELVVEGNGTIEISYQEESL